MTLMTNHELKTYVENNPNLVSMKETSIEGVYVLKYKKKVFYDNLWNEYLEECRGTLVDADFNLVSYPFTKIYNYGVEKKSPVLESGTYVTACRKVNGFMVAVTWHNDTLLVSTTGSTDSDFVLMARELIEPHIEKFEKVCKDYSAYTFMFECVHRNDPHIIPEEEGLYLIGLRAKVLGTRVIIAKDFHQNFGCFGVEHIECTIDTLQAMTKQVKHEGFVFYTEDGVSAKIKSPYYLVKKFVARNPNTSKLMDPHVKEKIDEEYYDLVDHIQANIVEFTELDEQARLEWVRNFLEEDNG